MTHHYENNRVSISMIISITFQVRSSDENKSDVTEIYERCGRAMCWHCQFRGDLARFVKRAPVCVSPGPWYVQPCLCDWVIKGLGMSSRVCVTG